MRFVCAYPTLLNLQVVFCQAWQMVEVSKMMNSSKFKGVRSPSPGETSWGRAPRSCLGWEPWEQTEPWQCPNVRKAPLEIRQHWGSSVLTPWQHHSPSLLPFHAFQRLVAYESTMVMLLASFPCFSCSMWFWYEKKKSARVRSHCWREKSIGNQATLVLELMELFSLCLKRKYVEKAKKSSLEGVDKAIMIPS